MDYHPRIWIFGWVGQIFTRDFWILHFSEDVSALVDGEYVGKPNQLIYGVFNTPVNAIGASAICAFSMNDIMSTFNGDFKYQENFYSNWLRVPNYKVSNFWILEHFG